MRVCYSLLLLRITAFYSLRLLIKRTKEYTCEIIIELKREREVWLMTRRPLCAQNTQKERLFFVSLLLRVVLKQRRRDGVVLRGKEGNISPLLFLNERFDQKTFCCFTTQEIRIILAYAALFDIIRILILL